MNVYLIYLSFGIVVALVIALPQSSVLSVVYQLPAVYDGSEVSGAEPVVTDVVTAPLSPPGGLLVDEPFEAVILNV